MKSFGIPRSARSSTSGGPPCNVPHAVARPRLAAASRKLQCKYAIGETLAQQYVAAKNGRIRLHHAPVTEHDDENGGLRKKRLHRDAPVERGLALARRRKQRRGSSGNSAPRISTSSTTTNSQGWLLAAEGACRATSSTFSTSSWATGSGLNRRTLRRSATRRRESLEIT